MIPGDSRKAVVLTVRGITAATRSATAMAATPGIMVHMIMATTAVSIIFSR
jgi:hypothetical protein